MHICYILIVLTYLHMLTQVYVNTLCIYVNIKIC